jgi:hypothetical protein
MSSRIFFKFTLDHEGLYSGDEFAAKAAGRELSGLESYLSFVLETGSKLRTAMQVHWKKRWRFPVLSQTTSGAD